MSADTPGSKEIFEAFQRMINPMAFPMQNLLMGGMKLEDIERKISELTTVHHWLSTNLGMLELSIKTLEYQKAILTPAKKDGKEAKDKTMPENPFLNPKNWPWPYAQPTEGGEKEEPKKTESRSRSAMRSKRTD